MRQLINKAGVPEEAIYIGDPYTQIFKHVYEKLSAEFPGVHYMSKSDVEYREQLQITNSDTIRYSDRGTILDKEYDQLFDCIVNADYVLSLPAIKGHRWAGVTFFAKNHFGSNTDDGASHLHPGLHRIAYDAPLRDGYNRYRVFVDLMSYEHLGGKTLIYIGDLLWGTSYEHDPPAKFLSAPFNNDWSSSIIVSMDPVAVSSVALDILQEEFQVEDLTTTPPRYTYIRFSGVDDYLHQAASSDWWPDGITYDPEGDGTPVTSLGVHEHWNNPVDKQYSRNLGTGEGIELVYQNIQQAPSSINKKKSERIQVKAYLSSGNSTLNLEFNQDVQGQIAISIYTLSGKLMQNSSLESVRANTASQISLDDYKPGYYLISIKSNTESLSIPIIVNH